MLDPNKIEKRLKNKFEHVKSFEVGVDADSVFFACNFSEETFTLVSIYMDSEIGGEFTLEPEYNIEDVFEKFDKVQAEEFRNGMIHEITEGNATVIGDINPKKLH